MTTRRFCHLFTSLARSAFILAATFCATALLSSTASAKSLTSSTSTSNLLVYSINGTEPFEEGGTYNLCGSRFRFVFNYDISSDSPFSLGDTAEIKLSKSSSIDHIVENTTKSGPYAIINDEGQQLAHWETDTTGNLIITIDEAGVDHTSLSGTIDTGTVIRIGTCFDHDVNQTLKAGWNLSTAATIHITIPAGANNAGSVAIGNIFGINVSDTYATWTSYPSSKSIDDIYKSSGTDSIAPENEIHDELETVVLPDATESVASFYLAVRAPWPAEWDPTGAHGISGTGNNIVLKNCSDTVTEFCSTRVTQGNLTRDEFIAIIKSRDLSYGIYEEEGQAPTAYINYGDFPNENMTYDEAIYTSNGKTLASTINGVSHISQPVKTGVISMLGNDNSVSGHVVFAMASISVNLRSGAYQDGSTVQATASFEYKDGNETLRTTSKSSGLVIHKGSAGEAVAADTAQLTLIDKQKKTSIANRDFKLQKKDGNNWVDVENSQRTTGEDGTVSVPNLSQGEYRWVQLNYATGYIGATTYYDSVDLNNAVESFTIDDAGVSLYAANERQPVTITFAGGEHASSSYRNIVRNLRYGDTIIAPDSSDIAGQTGWIFDGWNTTVASVATADTTYTAQWKREQTSLVVRLVWNDGHDYDGIRPANTSIIANLTLDNHVVDLSASFDANGQLTFNDLEKYDNSGNLRNWSAMVASTSNYTFTTTIVPTKATGIIIQITGEHVPRRQISICKSWNDSDNTENTRPEQFSFAILGDNVEVGTVNFTKNDTCVYSDPVPVFSDLANATPVDYNIQESSSAFYDSDIAIEPNEPFSYTVTNNLKAPTPYTQNMHVDSTVDDSLSDDETPTATLSPKSDSMPVPAGADDNRNTTAPLTNNGIDFGEIVFDHAGDYSYDITLNTADATSGDQNGNDKYTVRITIVRDENNDLKAQSIEYFDGDGNRVDPSDVTFNVTRLAPIPLTTDGEIDLPVEEELEEGAIRATLTPITDGAPMPNGNEDGITVDVNPDGSINIGEITITEPGEFEYRLKLDSDSYDIDQDEIIIRVTTSVDRDTNKIRIDDVAYFDKDGNPIDLSKFNLGIKKKETDNPNTSAEPIQIFFVTSGAILVSFGCLAYILRKRR